MLFSFIKGKVFENWILFGREFIETVFILLSIFVISPKTKGNDSIFFSKFGFKHQILFPIFFNNFFSYLFLNKNNS
jgi:hypothetical protein